MFVLKCNQPVYFDVDDTLVMWNPPNPNDPDVIEIVCPTSRTKRIIQELDAETGDLKDLPPDEFVEVGSWTERLKPHKKHIEAMKLHKLRGHTVIVWSAGGWEWAEAAIRALNLEKYVDLVLEKPMWCYDDLPPSEFIPKVQYIKE